MGDNVKAEYTKLAGEKGKPEGLRNGAKLLVTAEDNLAKDEVEKALGDAEEALKAFKDAKYGAGVADITRIIVSAHTAKDNRKEANKVAKEQLAEFRGSNDKAGIAKMLLSVAEVNGDRRGPKNREVAMEAAMEARTIFQELGNKKMEASALLEQANTLLAKNKGIGPGAEEALQPVNEALALFRQAGDKKGEAATLHALAITRVKGEAIAGGMQAAQEARALFKEVGDKKLEALELQCMAEWNLLDGDVEAVISNAEEALEIYKEIGNAQGEAQVRDIIVQANIGKGDVDKAYEVAQDGLQLFKAKDDKAGEAALLSSMLTVAMWKDDPEKALTCARDATLAYKGLGDKRGEMKMLHVHAQLQIRREQFSKASEAADAAQKLISQLGDNKDQAFMLHTLSTCALAKEENDKALKFANESQALYKKAGEARGEAASLMNIAAVHLVKNEADKALAAATEAQELLREVGEMHGEAHALHLISRIHVQSEEYALALTAAEGTRGIWRQLGETQREVGMLILITQICIFMLVEGARGVNRTSRAFYEGRGRAKALAVAKDAVAISRRNEDPLLLSFSLFVLARTYVSNGQLEDALRETSEALPLFKKRGDKRAEGSTLMLNANIHILSKNVDFATAAANDALLAFRGKDAYGEMLAENLIQRLQYRPAVGGAAAAGPADEVAEERDTSAESALVAKSSAVDIMSLPLPERVRYTIADLVAETTGKDDIEDDRTLMETGMTSISSIMLRDRIQDEFPDVEGMDLTFVFDYPTVREMSAFILDAMPE